MSIRSGLGLLCLCVICGCGGSAPKGAEPAPVVEPQPTLSIQGDWSPAVGLLRCRVLLDTNKVDETGMLQACVCIENLSGKPVDLSVATSLTASVTWKLGEQVMLVDTKAGHAQKATTTAQIGPAGARTDCVKLLAPAMPGRHDLVAALHTSTGPLVSSPIAVWVLPADWGETKDGLRFRPAATHGNWQVGQRPAVHLVCPERHRQASCHARARLGPDETRPA